MKHALELVAGIIILIIMLVVFWLVLNTPPVPVVPTPMQPELPLPEEPAEPDDLIACTMDAKQCPDGSYVGRIGPNCEFAACPDEVSAEGVACDPDNRPEACYDLYAPVCGLVQVQCVTAPCDPVPQTFSNDCDACANQNVISYTAGACE